MTAVWDTEKDFKLIGGQKYKDNKGYSTDIYLKVKDANGDEELLEVSLKKDTETFYWIRLLVKYMAKVMI